MPSTTESTEPSRQSIDVVPGQACQIDDPEPILGLQHFLIDLLVFDDYRLRAPPEAKSSNWEAAHDPA